MYDCIVPEFALFQQRRIKPQAVFDLRLEYRRWLHLKCAAGAGPAPLSKAAAVAVALGYRAEPLDDGSLAVLDIELEAALLLCQRLPELIGRYEVPARLNRS
ncbi:hypothetical protein [Silvimonas iriomotensis]|uniref:Uncharacterized protein n=1 Tax=Silvimonas iriomotensis TaxID=449662 RepID=A0ABQ2PD88_9NEIS|nr:hypothetical protein [Silvimonas iriomotensis]GGP23518.1 hypothetical protein GCM10010970_35180 [Silvimonas iriomotensis]